MTIEQNETEFYSPQAVDTRSIFGFIIGAAGLVLILFSAKPEWFGQNRSSVIGFIQLLAMLLGIGLEALGCALSLDSLWARKERSIVADFGMRLISTGYVIALFAGLSDIFTGAMNGSSGKSPQFGPYEQTGFEIGLVVIIIGLLMMIPYASLGKKEEPTQEKETA